MRLFVSDPYSVGIRRLDRMIYLRFIISIQLICSRLFNIIFTRKFCELISIGIVCPGTFELVCCIIMVRIGR